jgi:hypothetical protein
VWAGKTWDRSCPLVGLIWFYLNFAKWQEFLRPVTGNDEMGIQTKTSQNSNEQDLGLNGSTLPRTEEASLLPREDLGAQELSWESFIT